MNDEPLPEQPQAHSGRGLPLTAWAMSGGLVIGGLGTIHANGLSLLLFVLFGIALSLVVAIDLRERRIPNAVTYPGLLVALTVAALSGWMTLILALGGAAAAGGIVWGFFWLGRGAIGLGDVKLSALVGGAVGFGGVPLFLVAGTGIGAIHALVLLALGRDRRETFAYGPALAAGACIAVLVKGMVAA